MDEKELEQKLDELDRKVSPSFIRKRLKLALLKKADAGDITAIHDLEKLKSLESSTEEAAAASSPQPVSSGPVPEGAGASSDPPGDDEDPDPEKREILKEFAVRPRAYHMSEAALRQRREASRSGRKSDAMLGNANAWKTGEYARSAIRQFIRPCKSTCPQYPCELVAEGETAPGSECLDKKNVVKGIMAVVKAMEQKDLSDFREIVAVQIAHGMEVLRLLADDIMTNGVKHISKKIDKDGNVIGYELKPNPALLPYPKLLEVLNATPDHFMITDRAREKQKDDKEAIETIADKMARVGAAFLRARKSTVAGDAGEEPAE